MDNGNESWDFIGIGKCRIGLSNVCVDAILDIGKGCCDWTDSDEDGNVVTVLDSISIGLWK